MEVCYSSLRFVYEAYARADASINTVTTLPAPATPVCGAPPPVVVEDDTGVVSDEDAVVVVFSPETSVL